MSKFAPIKTTHSSLQNIPIKEGQVVFTYDKGEAYVDFDNNTRITIGSVIVLQSELDRLMVAAPLEYKLYFCEDSGKMYSYSASAWKCLNPDGVSSFVKLTDVPNSYTGCAGMHLSVKADETGLEFVSPNNIYNIVPIVSGLNVSSGQLLCLTSAGYKLADKGSTTTINDIVLAAGASSNGKCKVLEFGYRSATNLTPGSLVYLGTAGGITQTKPTSGSIKVVGYAISSTLFKFKPDSYYK